MAEKQDLEAVEKLNEARNKIKSEIKKVIVGQERVIDELLVALLSNGHCLLIGVPGLAKTLMISTIARILDLRAGCRHASVGKIRKLATALCTLNLGRLPGRGK